MTFIHTTSRNSPVSYQGVIGGGSWGYSSKVGVLTPLGGAQNSLTVKID